MQRRILLLFLILSFAFVLAQDVKAQDVKEDCIGFNPDKIEVKKIGNRWKIVEGDHWITDFGNKGDEANNALKIIKKYGFNRICFVGRPDPSMTYFTTKRENTRVVIVRHAEKGMQMPDDTQTPLTADGEKRAETLARMLDKSGVSIVYSTNYTRSRETVNNYADRKNIAIKNYNTPEEVTNLIKSQHTGKAVLVAGHSDTVPRILNGLGVSSAPQIDDEFNNLFIVTIETNGKTSLTQLKYEIDCNLR